MSGVPEQLTLAQISKDMNRLAEDFKKHADEDSEFQRQNKELHEGLNKSLKGIDARLGNIENKLNPKHPDYINKESDEKLSQLWTLFSGLKFGGIAIKWTASIIGALAVIIGSLFALIRFVK